MSIFYKKKTLSYAVSVALLTACLPTVKSTAGGFVVPDSVSSFITTDKPLRQAYEWARSMAISYMHDDGDSVGFWYEAALPKREAFCMRDVAHQSVAAHVLGAQAHNKNMLGRFAANITQGKDWCTYWEITRNGLPCPDDYANDSAFWYNLNANFDIVQACMKMYDWTADTCYINGSDFSRFHNLTFHQYVGHWQLGPNEIMHRPLLMHQPAAAQKGNIFHKCRGLASYVENFPGLTASADLLASLYAGYKAYGRICRKGLRIDESQRCDSLAACYRQLLDSMWWNDRGKQYYAFYTADHQFFSGEGIPFILWFGAASQPERITASIDSITSKEWNVESLSYLPALLYRYGYNKRARQYIVSLPAMSRCEYPEVSFGIVEGVVGGVMGIQPHDGQELLTEHHAEPATRSEICNVPLWDGTISLCHHGLTESTLTNHTQRTFRWKASFAGYHRKAMIAGKPHTLHAVSDGLGHIHSVAETDILPGQTLNIRCSE